MPHTCRFAPHSYSWVALHPQPKGVIQFIGGAFFGSYPTVFYRHFLSTLFHEGYTIVALPFRFSFRHWSIALSLLKEHYVVRRSVIESANKLGYEADIYLDSRQYAWVGHSLGCKYIVLLELLSATPESFRDYCQMVGLKPAQQQLIERSLSSLKETVAHLERDIQALTGKSIAYGQPSILHEASLLMAPAITDLDGAIPLKSLRRLFDRILTVYPTVDQTHELIRQSNLFNVTHFFEFERDDIARETCDRIRDERPDMGNTMLNGKHLEPVGIRIGRAIVDLNPMDKFWQPLSQRKLEEKSAIILELLRSMVH